MKERNHLKRERNKLMFSLVNTDQIENEVIEQSMMMIFIVGFSNEDDKYSNERLDDRLNSLENVHVYIVKGQKMTMNFVCIVEVHKID